MQLRGGDRLARLRTVAPAATSADCTASASLIRTPSTPIVTTWPVVTKVPRPRRGWPRGPARSHSDSWSPGSSCGAIVAGDQWTSHFPWTWTRCSVGWMLMVPTPVSASVSVNGSLAVDPLRGVPAVKLASWTAMSANAAWFTAVKSAGGFETSCCITAQFCSDQAVK